MVRIDSLSPGERFADVQGKRYVLSRRAGSICWAEREDGFMECFASNALVTRLAQ